MPIPVARGRCRETILGVSSHLDDDYAVDLTDLQRSVLRNGLFQWLGPARPTDAVASLIGFGDASDLLEQIHRLLVAVDASEPLSGRDWRRLLISTEVMFGSDVLGSGVEWPTVTGIADQTAMEALRQIQRLLVAVVRGQGAGADARVERVDRP